MDLLRKVDAVLKSKYNNGENSYELSYNNVNLANFTWDAMPTATAIKLARLGTNVCFNNYQLLLLLFTSIF